MNQAQESEQLSSNRNQSQSQRDFKIESTTTEQGLIVRVLSDVSEHHTDVYEGMVDKKQLTDCKLYCLIGVCVNIGAE